MKPKNTKENKEVLINPCERCGEKEGSYDLHDCPFVADVYDDHDYKCNCCDECKYLCYIDT